MILTYKLINKTGTLPVLFFVAYKSSILSVENIKEKGLLFQHAVNKKYRVMCAAEMYAAS